jgi:hypothetical protein
VLGLRNEQRKKNQLNSNNSIELVEKGGEVHAAPDKVKRVVINKINLSAERGYT